MKRLEDPRAVQRCFGLISFGAVLEIISLAFGTALLQTIGLRESETKESTSPIPRGETYADFPNTDTGNSKKMNEIAVLTCS